MTEKVIVTVNEGRVRGFKAKSLFSGVEYYNFLGLPYGQSTEGSFRYKDPVKVKPWHNIFDATVEKQGCLQFSVQHKILTGSEDCLYNNIYTPKIPSKGDPLKAVMVNIHPGGFFHGSPDPWYYGAPQFVMHHDIVYVCIAYRLHVLGHLNLKTKSCSGNQSLKDIILSLQWIKENISVFGGDPENITLMGSSSGSSIVHFLLLSPLTKGLYHKAILMGMYNFSPVVVTSHENASIAYNMATRMGYDGVKGEDKRLLTFYKNMNIPRMILTKTEQLLHSKMVQVYPNSPFIPTADQSENSPLPLSPEKLIPTTNRVPMMIGFCEREAAMALAVIKTFKRSIAQGFHKAIHQNVWGWGVNLTVEELKQIQKEVEDYYLDGDSIENAPQDILCDILTDAGLSDVYDTLINVIAEDEASPVYVYNFHYDGKLCTMRTRIARLMDRELQGAFHAADYSFWCYSKETAGTNMGCIQAKDREMIETFTSILTTFAKTTDPNNSERLKVNWKRTTPEHPSHLIINETCESRDEVLNGDRMLFWHKLKNKFKKECNNEP